MLKIRSLDSIRYRGRRLRDRKIKLTAANPPQGEASRGIQGNIRSLEAVSKTRFQRSHARQNVEKMGRLSTLW